MSSDLYDFIFNPEAPSLDETGLRVESPSDLELEQMCAGPFVTSHSPLHELDFTPLSKGALDFLFEHASPVKESPVKVWVQDPSNPHSEAFQLEPLLFFKLEPGRAIGNVSVVSRQPAAFLVLDDEDAQGPLRTPVRALPPRQWPLAPAAPLRKKPIKRAAKPKTPAKKSAVRRCLEF